MSRCLSFFGSDADEYCVYSWFERADRLLDSPFNIYVLTHHWCQYYKGPVSKLLQFDGQSNLAHKSNDQITTLITKLAKALSGKDKQNYQLKLEEKGDINKVIAKGKGDVEALLQVAAKSQTTTQMRHIASIPLSVNKSLKAFSLLRLSQHVFNMTLIEDIKTVSKNQNAKISELKEKVAKNSVELTDKMDQLSKAAIDKTFVEEQLLADFFHILDKKEAEIKRLLSVKSKLTEQLNRLRDPSLGDWQSIKIEEEGTKKTSTEKLNKSSFSPLPSTTISSQINTSNLASSSSTGSSTFIGDAIDRLYAEKERLREEKKLQRAQEKLAKRQSTRSNTRSKAASSSTARRTKSKRTTANSNEEDVEHIVLSDDDDDDADERSSHSSIQLSDDDSSVLSDHSLSHSTRVRANAKRKRGRSTTTVSSRATRRDAPLEQVLEEEEEQNQDEVDVAEVISQRNKRSKITQATSTTATLRKPPVISSTASIRFTGNNDISLSSTTTSSSSSNSNAISVSSISSNMIAPEPSADPSLDSSYDPSTAPPKPKISLAELLANSK